VRYWGQHQRPLQRSTALTDKLVVEDPLSRDISGGVLSCPGWNRMGRLGLRDNHHEYVARDAVPVPGAAESAVVILQFGCAASDKLYCWGSRLECGGPRALKVLEPIVDIEGGGSRGFASPRESMPATPASTPEPSNRPCSFPANPGGAKPLRAPRIPLGTI
jgi:hypothetical protein